MVAYWIHSSSRWYKSSDILQSMHDVDTATSVRVFSWLYYPCVQGNWILFPYLTHFIILIIIREETVAFHAVFLLRIVIAESVLNWSSIWVLWQRSLSFSLHFLLLLLQMLSNELACYWFVFFLHFLNFWKLLFKLLELRIISILDQKR